jgi:hypothetical protein
MCWKALISLEASDHGHAVHQFGPQQIEISRILGTFASCPHLLGMQLISDRIGDGLGGRQGDEGPIGKNGSPETQHQQIIAIDVRRDAFDQLQDFEAALLLRPC